MPTIQLVATATVGFADGNAGHVYTFPSGAPTVGDYDVLCVNSDTTVSTPAGFSAAPTVVGTQGTYMFRRLATGGEAATVTITTSGDFNATLTWSRWRYAHVADVAVSANVDGTPGMASPAVATGVLSSVNELVIAYAPLHGIVGADPVTPVWSSGYTALISGAVQGSGVSGVAAFTGYRTDAGTGSESPSVSWTNQTSERYMLVLTFTPKPTVEGQPGIADPGSGVAAINPGLVISTGFNAIPGWSDPVGSPAVAGTTPTLSAVPGGAGPAGMPAVTATVAAPVPPMKGTATVRCLSGTAVVS